MKVRLTSAVLVSGVVACSLLGRHGAFAAEEGRLSLADNTVHVNGLDIFYRIGGSGPPLLLLHGFTGVGHDWDRFLDEFGQHYTVIVPDLRGHGRSTNPSAEFSYRQSAGDMFALLDHLDFKRVRGIGYGAGGCTLLRMAALQAHRLEAMILVAGGHRLTPEAREVARAMPRFEDLPESWEEYNQRFHPGGERQVRMLLSQLRAFADSEDDYALTPEDLSAIPVKTFLVWGDRDEWHPMETVVELYEALPNSELWVVPGQGHQAMWPNLGGSELAATMFPALALQFLAADERQ